MGAGLKAGVLLAAAITVLNTIVGTAAGEIVTVVAAMTALGWLWSKMIRPAARTLQRTYQAVGALEDLGAFMDDTREAVRDAQIAARTAAAKAELLDRRMELLERHVGLFAAEDAVRVRQALVKDREQRLAEGPPQ